MYPDRRFARPHPTIAVAKKFTPFSRLFFVFVAAADNPCTARSRRGEGGVPEASAARTESKSSGEEFTPTPEPKSRRGRKRGTPKWVWSTFRGELTWISLGSGWPSQKVVSLRTPYIISLSAWLTTLQLRPRFKGQTTWK